MGSTPSRTKLNSVHAGLSLLLPPWNQHNSSKKVETSCLFPNKSSSPATPNATDVKVDGNPTVCNTLPNTDKPSRPHTHTPPEEDKPDLASIRDPHKSTSPRSTPFNPTLPPNFWPLSPKDQSPSPSKPTRWLSKVTAVESSIPQLAEPASITPSPLSDMETKTVTTTTSSEPPGDQPGEIKVTSSSPPL